MKRLAIFASGAGTNALNLIEKSRSFNNLQVSCVIVDTRTSGLPAIIAEKHPELTVYKIFPDKNLSPSERKVSFEKEILEKMQSCKIDWILLAGYMRLIGPTLLDAFENRIINIHPSLLPAYPGLNAFEKAWQDGVPYSGITIHLVDHGLDSGPVLLQEKFHRHSTDTLADFVQRGKEVEWELYPQILDKLSEADELLPRK